MALDSSLDRNLAYLVLRLCLGISIFLHGVTRLPHLVSFADGLAQQFAATPLPAWMVRPFAIGLVFVETLVGLLLLLGLWMRVALLLGSAAMAALIFGTALSSDWITVAIQLLYAGIYAALLATREYDAFSLDGFFSSRERK